MPQMWALINLIWDRIDKMYTVVYCSLNAIVRTYVSKYSRNVDWRFTVYRFTYNIASTD